MQKYSVIYADPPWQYRTYSKKGQGRSAESHYPTMSIDDIKALPVKELAEKDCALFMWITFPCLQEALQVLEAWGFSYKTVAFVWIKQNRISDSLFSRMGYWTRANAELCILATRGHPKRANPGVHQVIVSHIEQHHRHHKPVAGHKFSIGCLSDGELAGVVIAGRPVSRYLDDGRTLEVTRLCTNGAKNACSFLYGAAARAAAAMGYDRIITYTLESENGASLRASGWTCQGIAGGLC